MNSIFRALWLAHQTSNILRYSPQALIHEQTAFCVASVSEKETLKINEEGTLLNKKKETKLSVPLFDSKFFFFSSYIFDIKFSAGDRLRKAGCETCFWSDFNKFIKFIENGPPKRYFVAPKFSKTMEIHILLLNIKQFHSSVIL